MKTRIESSSPIAHLTLDDADDKRVQARLLVGGGQDAAFVGERASRTR